MKNPNYKSIIRLASTAFVALAAGTAIAQDSVFYENWETDHSLDNTYITNQTASSVNYVNLYFDYSAAGVPLSPNSTNSSTRALKMSANLSGAIFGGVSISPVGFGITDNFDMRFDAWFNFNGPFPLGGSGSTQIGGAGYGTAGTNAQTAGVADSVFIGGSVDGNSSADYRVYSSGHPISYQDGSFRIGSSGTISTILGDPNSGYVYARTNRNAQPFYDALFPAQQCPAAQFALYPQQTNSNGTLPGQPGFASPGNLAFKWHDISLKKLGNTITYSIDGFLIATVDVNDAGALGGTNILFNHYDINSGSSSDPNDSNLIFTLIDNVRITNYANVVTVYSTNAPSTAEAASPTPGVFTIVRTDAANSVDINYTLTGSAGNGVDFTNLSGTVTIAAGSFSTNIFVHPIDDFTPEVTEAVVLDIAPGAYIGGGSATITIVDNEPGELAITNISSQMYERTNDFAAFRITRLGNTNVASFPVNLSFTGSSATSGADFYMTNTVSFDIGFQSTNIVVLPIEDLTFEGSETVTVNIAPPTTVGDYTIGASGSASVTIVDADGPPETVLFADNFDVDSSANWDVFHATTNGVDDNTVLWAFDYTGFFSMPASPHGGGNGLFMTVNKNDLVPVAGALNAYPKLQNFSGNFALRFDMSLNMSGGTSATEYALLGINHSGTKTNWFRGSAGGVPAGWTFDGLFYAIETDGGSAPHYINYSAPTTVGNNPTALTAGTNVAGFTQAFKSPPWAVAGSPAVNLTNATPGPVWADVELSKIGSLITMRINKQTILRYTNATPYTSGNVMIGYVDSFDSIGDSQRNFVIFDNLRVISLQSPLITQLQIVGPNVQIDFTAHAADVVAQFVLQSSSNVAGPYVDTTSTLTSPSAGNFRSTVGYNPLDTPKFYRIRRAY